METASLQFRQHAYLWKDSFVRTDRQLPHYEMENRRKAQQPQEYINEDGVVTLELIYPNPSTHQVIDTFVDNECQGNLNRYLYRQPLRDFLAGATMEGLQAPLSFPILRKSAILDDRSMRSDGSFSGDVRVSCGPLTARQFYVQLLKKRIGIPSTPNAERRLIYIVDVDPEFALALAATVSPSQASFLRDFSYTHLAFETSLKVQIRSVGRPTFSLVFHLPYYAWRREYRDNNGHWTGVRKDPRELRPSDEVIKFRRPKQKGNNQQNFRDYIHHAQVSVMIAGLDDRFWTSHCFVDLYFEDENHDEQAKCLSEDSEHHPPMDPNSCGLDTMNTPKWNPRHYFLRSLSCRMGQIRQEWHNTIYQLKREIDPCLDAFVEHQDRKNSEGNRIKFIRQEEFNWSRRTLRQFTHLITKSIKSWETFKSGEIHYFDLPESEATAQKSWGALIADIDSNVEELRNLRGELVHRTELFETMTTNILTHATHEESMTTKLQSRFVQALTVITIAYLPPSLASTIFSMQSPIISDPQFKHYIYTVVGLFLATGFLILALSIPNHIDVPKISKIMCKWILIALARPCSGIGQVFWYLILGCKRRWKMRAERRSGRMGRVMELGSVSTVNVRRDV